MTSLKMVAVHLINLSKDGSEVSVLTSTKMVTGHMFVLFQSSSNLELQDFQILLYQIQQCPEAKRREHSKSDIQKICGHISQVHTYKINKKANRTFPPDNCVR